MAKLRIMGDDKTKANNPPKPATKPVDVDNESEADDASLTGDTIMEWATIPFFVGGESFIKEVDGGASATLENPVQTIEKGHDQASDQVETVSAPNDLGDEAAGDDDDENDDTVTSFSHYDSLFPDES